MPSELSHYTTLQVGGPAREFFVASTRDELIDLVHDVWASGEQLFVLGGGSNVVVSDDGFDGAVIKVETRGIDILDASTDVVRIRVQAGESWDALVATTVERGWNGFEGLSGIPGSTGAAPIQNIGAYGQEISERLVGIEFLDFLSGELEYLTAADLELGYRSSAIKYGREGVVISVDFELAVSPDGLSAPIAYDQLAKALGVSLGDRVPLATVRETVLALRASKGMVLNPDDLDSVSAGSFFTNPIVGENFARTLPDDAPRWPLEAEPIDLVVPLGFEPAVQAVRTDFRVKLSAAWLIERAGIHRGFSLPGSRAAISSKHTLAITNRGGATADEIAQLARFVQTRVFSEFGVKLQPEPVFVGHAL